MRAGHWPSLLGAWLHFEVSFMVWLLIGALGVAISAEFGLTATQKGILVATPLLGGALLRLVVGPVADRFGAKNVGLGLLGLEIFALLLGWSWGTSYLHMIGTGFVLGFAGASFAIALPLASQAYPPAHQGLAMGVAAVGNSGVLLATFIAPRLAESVGWAETFGFMIIPVVITMAFFWGLIPNRHGSQFTQLPDPITINEALSQPFMYWLCFLYGITFGGFVGLSSFFPIFFHDQYGLNMVTAGTMTALCGLAGSAARPVGGFLADQFGGMVLLPLIFPCIAVLSFLMGFLLPFPLMFPLSVGLLLMLGFGNGMVFQVASLRYQSVMGTASGFIGAAGGIGGFFLPFCFGIIKDLTNSYGFGFFVYGTITILASASAVMAQRSFRASIQRL